MNHNIIKIIGPGLGTRPGALLQQTYYRQQTPNPTTSRVSAQGEVKMDNIKNTPKVPKDFVNESPRLQGPVIILGQTKPCKFFRSLTKLDRWQTYRICWWFLSSVPREAEILEMTTAAEGEDFRPSDDEYERLQEDVERARVEGNQKVRIWCT